MFRDIIETFKEVFSTGKQEEIARRQLVSEIELPFKLETNFEARTHPITAGVYFPEFLEGKITHLEYYKLLERYLYCILVYDSVERIRPVAVKFDADINERQLNLSLKRDKSVKRIIQMRYRVRHIKSLT